MASGKPEASVADPDAVTHTIRLKSGANGFSELLDGTETGLVTYLGLNIYGFIMPEEDVHLRMLFLRKKNPFLDVNETQLFYTPVLWAVEKGITAGIRATAKTSDNNQAVTAASSNPGVARVELTKVYNGYDCRFAVKFNGVGAATITITSEDGNVSKHYTIIVYDSYETPIGRRLTPEQFVTCMNGILVENGARINTTMGWHMMTLSDSDLTGDNA